jgi:hypothetical protein
MEPLLGRSVEAVALRREQRSLEELDRVRRSERAQARFCPSWCAAPNLRCARNRRLSQEVGTHTGPLDRRFNVSSTHQCCNGCVGQTSRLANRYKRRSPHSPVRLRDDAGFPSGSSPRGAYSTKAGNERRRPAGHRATTADCTTHADQTADVPSLADGALCSSDFVDLWPECGRRRLIFSFEHRTRKPPTVQPTR